MSMPSHQARPFSSPQSLLTELVLGVHQVETGEDLEARRILDELLHELGIKAGYEVVKVPFESKEYPLPYLRFSRSSVYGLDKIREVAERERSFR